MNIEKTQKDTQFQLHDLALAYRKAKVDLYYSSHANLQEIVDYEGDLESNLVRLLEKLNTADEGWINEADFLGSYILVPAGAPQAGRYNDNNLFHSDPNVRWRAQQTDSENKKDPIELRLMAQNSVEFHVLSALWLMEVGDHFDAKLSQSAYGNRLRRTEKKDLNKLSVGSFNPYMKHYREWRDRGINAIKTGLAADKSLVALSTDFSAYYHRLSPDFMLNQEFCKSHSIQLNSLQSKLHRLFIKALQNWAKTTPLKAGLPVGLPASAVVANMALLELDKVIQRELSPIYYGRYVDDIILVFENSKSFECESEVWDWLSEQLNNLLSAEDDDTIRYRPDYLSDCRVELSKAKTKMFFLDPKYGPYLVDSISRHIQERGSEWRALPNLPESAEDVKTSIVYALDSSGAPSESLGKADQVSARRAAFALKLRDFEAYARDLNPADWEDQRHALFEVAVQHILVLPNYLDMASYLPRLIRLATACEDFQKLKKMLEALDRLHSELQTQECFGIKGNKKLSEQISNKEVLESLIRHAESMLKDCVSSAFPLRLSRKGAADWRAAFGDVPKTKRSLLLHIAKLEPSLLKDEQLRYFEADLAYTPFRYMGLPNELYPTLKKPSKKQLKSYINPGDLLSLDATKLREGLGHLAEWSGLKRNQKMPLGLVFSTRPLGLIEIFFLDCRPFDQEELEKLRKVILALRGFTPQENWPTYSKEGVLRIQDGEENKTRRIALTSWKTEVTSWIAAVMRQPEPDATRYQRLMSLVDNIVRHDRELDYLVLPECSIPCAWFMRLVTKLRNSRISLIAGVQYIHAPGRKVRNQVWAALTHDGIGFPSVLIYRQDKQLAALHEERELKRLNNLTLRPKQLWPIKGDSTSKKSGLIGPPVIQHGRFMFAVLICSELTNIQYRAALRGKIDALFVPEWNQDTNSFEPLVESAALDVHAYIIQCNDRQHGDSRIRAPFKDSWQRDLIRVRGGLQDYYVVGEIDFQALRNFQSSYRSPEGPFKPVPDGFQISHDRKGIIED